MNKTQEIETQKDVARLPISSKKEKRSVTPRLLLLVLIVPVLALSGCISRSTYNRDMAKLLNRINRDQVQFVSKAKLYKANEQNRAVTLNKLTSRYMQLQKKHSTLLTRYSHFDKDLNEFSHDISELKLVISKNMDKIRSSMANEMLIKIIDMEFRVEELKKKDAEELQLAPIKDEVMQDTLVQPVAAPQ